ncbi:unnamed protein product [Mortierella alpina]
MEITQSSRLTEAMDAIELSLTYVGGQTTVSWEDIRQAFPGVRHVRDGKSVIKFQRNRGPQSRVVMEVVMTTSIEPGRVNPLKNCPADGDCNPFAGAEAGRALDALKAFGKAIHHAHAENSRDELSAESNRLLVQKIEAIYVARIAELQDTITAKHEELQAVITNNTAVINTKRDEIKQLQKEALDNQEKMKRMQESMLEQLAVLQSRVQAIFTQNYEPHEYPIPRLFVVLPQDSSRWDALNPFANKFRLYFLCECGEHTKAINSKTGIPHHIHFAKHEGYEIARPSKFFEQYDPYVLTILKMIKYSITVAGMAMPAFSQLISPDILGQSITSLKVLEDTIVPGADQVIGMMDSISDDPTEGIEGITGQAESKEALESVDLRMLVTILKEKGGNMALGDLYRTVTDEGHVKWVCINHYQENFNRTSVETLRRAVESLGGFFDENEGLVQVDLRSRAAAKQFYLAMENARSVQELNIILNWDCTTTDLQLLEEALTKSAVMVLHLDLGLIKLSNFTPKRPPHLRKLSCEIEPFPNTTASSIRIYAELLKTGSTVTTVYQGENLVRPCAAKALAESLKNSWELTTLDLSMRSVGVNGAQALSEGLTTNRTLITLDLSWNSIGDSGAQALSEALKTNATLTTLDLGENAIGYSGAQALSEVLIANLTLTTLVLANNCFGANGAQALSEALRTNATLTTLNVGGNSIGDSGAQALCKVLMTNLTLTTLVLSNSSIGANGAQALSEALRTNATLITLDLTSNSIGDKGAAALSEALMTNSTLTTLILEDSSIGANGAQALSEALKTNPTLSTLRLEINLIGDDGAEALSEALKINSALTYLGLGENSIGDSGAQALSQALKTNSALTTLNLTCNSIGDTGAQTLSEALMTNSTLTFLGLWYNSIRASVLQPLTDALERNSTRVR